MIRNPDGHMTGSEGFDPTHVNDFVEAFERFSRNSVSPSAERAVYTFEDLQPPYFFPEAVTRHSRGEPIESVDVHLAIIRPAKNVISVAFQLAGGSSLQLSRHVEAAQLELPFVLSRSHTDIDRDPELLDEVEPSSVSRFLSGLALGADTRRQLALQDTEGNTHYDFDPQSLVFFSFIAPGLKDRAAYSEVTKRYRTPVQTRQGVTHQVAVETVSVSNGHNEYSMDVVGQDNDGDASLKFGLSLGVSHDYSRNNKPTFDINGSHTKASPIETLDRAFDKETLSAYGLAILNAITPSDIPTESLRQFWV